LGGNVILKCLGELGEEAVSLGVSGAAVACVPFDAVRSSRKIDSGFNGAVYAANFLSTLKPKAERKWTRWVRVRRGGGGGGSSSSNNNSSSSRSDFWERKWNGSIARMVSVGASIVIAVW